MGQSRPTGSEEGLGRPTGSEPTQWVRADPVGQSRPTGSEPTHGVRKQLGRPGGSEPTQGVRADPEGLSRPIGSEPTQWARSDPWVRADPYCFTFSHIVGVSNQPTVVVILFGPQLQFCLIFTVGLSKSGIPCIPPLSPLCLRENLYMYQRYM